MLGSLADRFQRRNRQRKADWLDRFIADHDVRTVLFVGVGIPPRWEWEGLIERTAAERADWVVWSGLACGDRDMRPLVLADGLRLPFPDGAFDLVYSNAVIEHVGGEVEQRAFLDEQGRVATWWVTTTPNRWFPVESHTRVLLRHWMPGWRARQTRFTRLLSRRELVALCAGVRVVGSAASPTFIAWGHTTQIAYKASR